MDNVLTPEQIETLSELDKCFREKNYVLIGGLALKLQIPNFRRDTEDIDLFLTVNLENLQVLDTLLPGWKHHENAEQRWISPSGIATDIIPICKELMDGNFLIWPKTGNRMNLTGYHHAYEHALEFQMNDDLVVSISPCHIIVLLKIIAYMDKPYDRIKDLEDIVFILAKYIDELDERRWLPLDKAIEYRSVPAFFVAADLKGIIGQSEMEILREFLARIESEDDRYLTQANLIKAGHKWLHYTDEDIFGLFNAFSMGLE